MSENIRNLTCPDFSDALLAAKDAGEIELDGKSIGLAFNRSRDTGEEIIKGAWNLRLRELRLVMFSPFARVFLEWLTCGTDYVVVKRQHCGDLDGDGDIDKDDVLAGAICVTATLTDQLKAINEARSGKGYTSAESARLVQLIGIAGDKLNRVCRAVVELTLRRQS